MKINIKHILTAVTAFTVLAASAQGGDNEKYAVKLTATNSFGDALSTNFANPSMTKKNSESKNLEIDFGCTIWQHSRNSLEANIGVGYNVLSLKAEMAGFEFNYSAPAEADMDRDTYIRYSKIDGLHQNIKTERITLPLYLDYRFKCSKVFSLHALLGFRFGYSISSKVTENYGSIFNYGIYPQYDDLMIDAPYLNAFGSNILDKSNALDPTVNKLSAAFLTGIGAEFRIFGPLAIEASVRYERGMTNIYRTQYPDVLLFNAGNAPVTYTVAEGQKVSSLSRYLTLSQPSTFSYALSLLLRF